MIIPGLMADDNRGKSSNYFPQPQLGEQSLGTGSLVPLRDQTRYSKSQGGGGETPLHLIEKTSPEGNLARNTIQKGDY